MPRSLRFILPGQMVEVTIRTQQSRLLLRPSKELNAAILAVLGRALHLYDVALCGFAVLSNHAHFLAVPADGQELARFMQFLNCNISKAVGRLHDWRGAMWERRYRAIPVVDEASQVARLRYVLAQGCAEGLVMRPEDWPGLHCARALLGREVLCGTWLDRSGLYHARRDGRDVGVEAFQTRYAVNLAPLPCWAGMSADEYRAQCAAMVAEIEVEARLTNAALGRVPVGARHVLAQHPHARPRRTNRRLGRPGTTGGRLARPRGRIAEHARRTASSRFAVRKKNHSPEIPIAELVTTWVFATCPHAAARGASATQRRGHAVPVDDRAHTVRSLRCCPDPKDVPSVRYRTLSLATGFTHERLDDDQRLGRRVHLFCRCAEWFSPGSL